jgi:predicted nucleic acid-binding protein
MPTTYLLDSDTASDLYAVARPVPERMLRRMAGLANGDRLAVSVVTAYELEYGYAHAPAAAQAAIRAQIDAVLADCSVLPIDPAGARAFGEAKARIVAARNLSKDAARKINYDVMIATQALLAGAVLVSSDKIHRELAGSGPLAGLAVEDWNAGP